MMEMISEEKLERRMREESEKVTNILMSIVDEISPGNHFGRQPLLPSKLQPQKVLMTILPKKRGTSGEAGILSLLRRLGI